MLFFVLFCLLYFPTFLLIWWWGLLISLAAAAASAGCLLNPFPPAHTHDFRVVVLCSRILLAVGLVLAFGALGLVLVVALLLLRVPLLILLPVARRRLPLMLRTRRTHTRAHSTLENRTARSICWFALIPFPSSTPHGKRAQARSFSLSLPSLWQTHTTPHTSPKGRKNP